MTFYRRYSPQWDRTGWADTPQYAGQQPCVDEMDYPPGQVVAFKTDFRTGALVGLNKAGDPVKMRPIAEMMKATAQP